MLHRSTKHHFSTMGRVLKSVSHVSWSKLSHLPLGVCTPVGQALNPPPHPLSGSLRRQEGQVSGCLSQSEEEVLRTQVVTRE